MNKAMSKSEPASHGVRFMVGRDAGGRWIVSDRDGLVGGLFTDRASAVHFAIFESDHVPGAVCCVPDDVTLNLNSTFESRPASPGVAGFHMKVAGRA